MNIFNELLPSIALKKSTDSKKDKRHHKKPHYRQEQIKQIRKTGTIVLRRDLTLKMNENSNERRFGGDRRNNIKSRGRWLESRLIHDRRKGLSIYVQI